MNDAQESSVNIRAIVTDLELQLRLLDSLGSKVAAAYVDAAVAQLKSDWIDFERVIVDAHCGPPGAT